MRDLVDWGFVIFLIFAVWVAHDPRAAGRHLSEFVTEFQHGVEEGR